MLRAAARAPDRLRERRDRIATFVRGLLRPDGAFRDRRGNGDLYYTLFGIECLAALAAELPVEPLTACLRRFGEGESLDLVHLACLARCWSAVGGRAPREPILRRIASHRRDDGGFAGSPASAHGSAYASFLALGAYQDLGEALPDPDGLARCASSLRTADGGYANEPGAPVGLTPAAAAAVTVLQQLRRPIDPAMADWLVDRHRPDGGFVAAPPVPLPDLLSTATALHALSAMGVPLAGLAGPCEAFIESLWDDRGGFRGHAADDEPDCEYTFYGLLALGHLIG